MRPVLYAEDDPDDRELTLIHLRGAGLGPFVCVRGGADALDYLSGAARGEAEAPCLLLSDVDMPGMNGLELLERLRADARWSALPFAFFTSSDHERDRALAERLGADLYLLKPIGSGGYAELVRRLRPLIGVTAVHQT